MCVCKYFRWGDSPRSGVCVTSGGVLSSGSASGAAEVMGGSGCCQPSPFPQPVRFPAERPPIGLAAADELAWTHDFIGAYKIMNV